MAEKIRILLVEDDIVDAKNFERVLNRINVQYSFEHLNDIDKALESLKESVYDVIFLDYHLPKGNSLDVLNYLKKIKSKTPVIIVTSYANPKVAVELIQQGAMDYIPKSLLNEAGLAQTIRGALRVKDLQDKRVKTENRLRKVENRLGTIISNTPVILFVLDHNGIVQLGLGKYWDSFNPKSYSLIGVGFQEAFRNFPRLIESFEKSNEGRIEVCKVEINEVVFEVTFTPRLNADGSIQEVLGLAMDVTGHEKGKQSLTKAKQIAEKASQMKQEFIANMSHEIRTPMNAIIGFANLLSETKMDHLQTDFVDSIKTSGENLLALVNDILDFSKIESGKLIVEKEDFEPRKLVKSLIDVLEVRAVERKNSLSFSIQNNIPETLVGDPNRVYQVLMNLVNNAIKFTKEGKVELEIGIQKEEISRLELFFRVKDSGIGIPENKLDEIFESFVQVEGGSNRKTGGTGLGLAIVKKLINLMNGSISVESKEGEGAVFEVILPFNISFKKSSDKANNKERFKSIKGKRILLAEDNEMNQKLVIMYLTKYDVKIDLAENGHQAVKAAQANDYDLILMDIQMPEMDGLEATKKIRELEEDKAKLPIIAMTAHAFKEEVENCFKVGMNAHISKPIEKEAFLTLISSLVHSESTDLSDSKTVAVKDLSGLVDLSYLRDMSDGNEEFIQEMIKIFKADSPVLIERMQNSFDKKDWPALSKVAHKFRSPAVMMGMKDVAKIAERIEYFDYSENDGLDDVLDWIHQIDQQSSAAIDYIQKNF